MTAKSKTKFIFNFLSNSNSLKQIIISYAEKKIPLREGVLNEKKTTRKHLQTELQTQRAAYECYKVNNCMQKAFFNYVRY